ncbi:MAG: hypothetical protein V1774_00680 [Candidatus Eisenbacteria bacterium]
MTLKDVAQELAARVLVGVDEDLAQKVETVAAGDLMSDILARADIPDLLVTGLATIQTIRTASVAGIKTVIIVRGKVATEEMIELAREEGLLLMVTKMKLFEAAGRLWAKGLRTGEPRA